MTALNCVIHWTAEDTMRLIDLPPGWYNDEEDVEFEEFDIESIRAPDPDDGEDYLISGGMDDEIYEMRISDFVESAIEVVDPHSRENVPFSFEERRYLRRVYNTESQRRLLMCGRQVEKSSFLGYYSLALSCLVPKFKTLYVSPSSAQTKEFSKSRLKEPIETCGRLRGWFPPRLVDNVFEKAALNRSTIKLRYAFLSADRVRGQSADMILIDEFQDILIANIPIIEECSSHSPYRLSCYTGTPKTLDNPIQHFWDERSTKNEWAVPCERHGTPNDPGSWHWNILGERNIGRKSLICDRCGMPIDARHPMADWVSTAPHIDPESAGMFEGFRIPQLMVPWIPWHEIVGKYDNLERGKFFNEVLGHSYDNGQRPLSRADVMANCDPAWNTTADFLRNFLRTHNGPLYAGIDWGQDTANSYTVMSIGTYVGNFFRIIYIYRFQGPESAPGVQLEIISKLIERFSIRIVGADYGGGWWPNSELISRFGDRRILRYQYSSPSQYLVWDAAKGRYLFHKHEVMSAIFGAIKRANVFRFPRAEDFMDPYGADMLSIFSEYNERTRMTEYRVSVNGTDDSLHAILLCFLASMLERPRIDIFNPAARVTGLNLAL